MNHCYPCSCVCGVLLSLCLLTSAVGLYADNDGKSAEPLVKTTYVYKTVGELKVEADVYRPDGAENRPLVVWIHGGALLVGSRAQVPPKKLPKPTCVRSSSSASS